VAQTFSPGLSNYLAESRFRLEFKLARPGPNQVDSTPPVDITNSPQFSETGLLLFPEEHSLLLMKCVEQHTITVIMILVTNALLVTNASVVAMHQLLLCQSIYGPQQLHCRMHQCMWEFSLNAQ
jgi:hypothetical protein